jgi:hypothetical protein
MKTEEKGISDSLHSRVPQKKRMKDNEEDEEEKEEKKKL